MKLCITAATVIIVFVCFFVLFCRILLDLLLFAMLEKYCLLRMKCTPSCSPFLALSVSHASSHRIPLKPRGIRGGANCILSTTGPPVSKNRALQIFGMNEVWLRLVRVWLPCNHLEHFLYDLNFQKIVLATIFQKH